MAKECVPLSTLKQTIIVVTVAALFWAVVFLIDLFRIKSENEPILSIPLSTYCVDSANSEHLSYSVTEYWGIGYKVMKYKFDSGKNVFQIGPWSESSVKSFAA